MLMRRTSSDFVKLLRLVFAGAGVLVATQLSGAVVKSGSLTVTLHDDLKGMVVSLADARGVDYASHFQRMPLWSATLVRREDCRKTKTVDAMAAGEMKVERTADGVRLVYAGFKEGLETFVCEVKGRPDDPSLRWRFEATPKAPWALYRTDFPQFAMSEALGATPRDDAIAMGFAKGGVVRDPMSPMRSYWRFQERLYGSSPGYLAAQWAAYWDPSGGLYTAAEDDRYNAKELLFDRYGKVVMKNGEEAFSPLKCRWTRFEYSETPDAQPYDIVMRGFSAADGSATDWQDAVDLYRAWVTGKEWCRTKFIDRPDIPQWAKEGPAIMFTGRSALSRPHLVERQLEWYQREFNGAPLLVMNCGWEHNGEWISPEYFPCHPSDELFRRHVELLKAHNAHLWPWPSGHNWNIRVGKNADGTYKLDYSKDYEARVRPHAICRPDGEPDIRALSWLGGGESATMCAADPWTLNWFNEEIAAPLVERGAELIQFDQDNCGRLRDCWSRSHGHKPGFGQWTALAYRNQLKTCLAALRRHAPQAQCSFEEPCELYNDLLSFQDTRNCRFQGGEIACSYNYLYHEYQVPVQPGEVFHSRQHWMAFCAADGQAPRLPSDFGHYFDMPVLENGDFEVTALGLRGFAGWWECCDSQIISREAHSGSFALGLVSTNRMMEVGRTYRGDYAKAGGKFRLTGWAKVRKGGGYLKLGQALTPVRGAAAGGSDDWQRACVVWNYPKDCAGARVSVRLDAQSDVLFDDFLLERQEADGTWKEVTKREKPEALAFCTAWCHVYRDNLKFLQHGRAVKPPQVICERLRYEDDFRGDKATLEIPAVYHSAWQAADGERALYFVNATEQRRNLIYRSGSGWKSLSLPPRGMKFVRE